MDLLSTGLITVRVCRPTCPSELLLRAGALTPFTECDVKWTGFDSSKLWHLFFFWGGAWAGTTKI